VAFFVQRSKLRVCKFDFRNSGTIFLRVSTYISLEEPDILQTIEGLLWQATLRYINGLLWQVDQSQSSSKPPEKNFPHGSVLPELWCSFLSRVVKGKSAYY
jgi:hypothetical protein